MRLSPVALCSLAALVPLVMVPGAACTGEVSVSTEIGPAGGVVNGPDGVRIVVPAGALSSPASLVIRKVPASAAPALDGALAFAGDVYSFEPHGLAFSAPVQVRLPAGHASAVLHASCASGTTGASACETWDAPLGGVSLQDGFAVFDTQGFSLYAPASAQGGTGGTGGMGGTASTGSTGGGAGGTGGAPTCSGVFPGNALIKSSADLDALAGYCEIAGELRVATNAPLSDVALPLLERIDGQLIVDPGNWLVKSLSFPALLSVKTFSVQPDTVELSQIDLDSLETIDGDFVIAMGQVPKLTLPSLHAVTGSMWIYVSTTTFEAPVLETIGGSLSMSNTVVTLPALTTIGGSLGLGSPAMTALDLPALLSIGGALDLDPWVGGKPCWPENGSPVLAALHLPLLASLGSGNTGTFNLGYTPMLPQCHVDAITQQLQQAGWTGQVTNASPTACQTAAGPCP